MKLFVDDMRACPNGWHPARTVTEAIRSLATMHFEEVSLDHDIASECTHLPSRPFSLETFEAVARYIALMPCKPRITFHCGAPERGEIMAEIIGVPFIWRHYPDMEVEVIGFYCKEPDCEGH